MPEEQIQAFINTVKSNTSLNERLKAAADSDAVVAIAKEAGFEISKAEVDGYLSQQTAGLSDVELEAVAGGGQTCFGCGPGTGNTSAGSAWGTDGNCGCQ